MIRRFAVLVSLCQSFALFAGEFVPIDRAMQFSRPDSPGSLAEINEAAANLIFFLQKVYEPKNPLRSDFLSQKFNDHYKSNKKEELRLRSAFQERGAYDASKFRELPFATKLSREIMRLGDIDASTPLAAALLPKVEALAEKGKAEEGLHYAIVYSALELGSVSPKVREGYLSHYQEMGARMSFLFKVSKFPKSETKKKVLEKIIAGEYRSQSYDDIENGGAAALESTLREVEARVIAANILLNDGETVNLKLTDDDAETARDFYQRQRGQGRNDRLFIEDVTPLFEYPLRAR